MIVDRPRDPYAAIARARGAFEDWTKPSGYSVRIRTDQRTRIQAWQWSAPILTGGRGWLFVCDMCVVGQVFRDRDKARRWVAWHRRCGFVTHFPDDPLTEL